MINVDLFEKYIYLEETTSTNDICKTLGEDLGLRSAMVRTDFQTEGRGTRQRTWTMSKGKNLIFSLMMKPDIDIERAGGITLLMALSIVKILNSFKEGFMIKWPNDIVYNGKKVLGILTEISVNSESLNYIVIGVGINCNEEYFPKKLEDKAVSLRYIIHEEVDVVNLLNLILEEFYKNYEEYLAKGISFIIDDLRKYSAIIDKKAEIIKGHISRRCLVIGLSDKAELTVKYEDETVDNLVSAQITVDGFYGISLK